MKTLTKKEDIKYINKGLEENNLQNYERIGYAEIYKATYNGTCKYVVIDRWGFSEVYDDYITALETFRECVYDVGEE